MFTVWLMEVDFYYTDPLPARCMCEGKLFETASSENAESFRDSMSSQFPYGTYKVAPLAGMSDIANVTVSA